MSSRLADSILEDLPTPVVQSLNTLENKVTEFPAPETPRMQDIILSMILKGTSLKDIADTVRMTEVAVMRIAQSTWASKELERMAVAVKTPQDSIRNLLRVGAFPAVIRLHKLVDSPNHNVAMGAIRLILEHTLAPIKENDLDQGKKPVTSDEAKNEAARIDREIEALTQRRTTPT